MSELENLTTPPEGSSADESTEADVSSSPSENEQPEPEASVEDIRQEVEEAQDAETEPLDDEAYDKAWEEGDDSFEEFFRDETPLAEEPVEETAEEPAEQEVVPSDTAEPEPVPQEGLVIKNPVLKFKGKEVPVESEEELLKLASKGLKLEIEMQKIKPQKRLIATIEKAGITPEEIQALADLKAGKPEAIKYLAKTTGVDLETMSDPYADETTGSDYEPQVEAENPIQDYWNEISAEKPEVAGKALSIIKEMDESFKAEIGSDPQIFKGFVEAVEMGEFEQAYPYAVKIKAMNPSATWIQAYGLAVQQLLEGRGSQDNSEKKEPPASATVPKKAPTRKTPKKDLEKRIWEDDDFEQELWNKAFA